MRDVWIPPKVDPERFGTILDASREHGWVLVSPFDEKMYKRAISNGAIEEMRGQQL